MTILVSNEGSKKLLDVTFYVTNEDKSKDKDFSRKRDQKKEQKEQKEEKGGIYPVSGFKITSHILPKSITGNNEEEVRRFKEMKKTLRESIDAIKELFPQNISARKN